MSNSARILQESPKFLSMNNFIAALNNDPCAERPQLLQSLYACTGRMHWMWLHLFLQRHRQRNVLRHFISACLIGNIPNDPALYSGFKLDTPKALYNSIQGALQHHSQWLNKIREVTRDGMGWYGMVWERADNEEHVLPSTEAPLDKMPMGGNRLQKTTLIYQVQCSWGCKVILFILFDITLYIYNPIHIYMQSSLDTDGQEVTQLTSGMGHSRESTRLAAKPDVALVEH